MGEIELAGRRLGVSERLELGDLLVVHLAESAVKDCERSISAPSRVDDAGDVDNAAIFLDPDGEAKARLAVASAATLLETDAGEDAAVRIAATPGAFVCPTQRMVLVVAYESGMDQGFALKVCLGIAQYLIEDGHHGMKPRIVRV